MNIRWLSLILLFSLTLASCAPSETESLPPLPKEAPSEKPVSTSTENPLLLINNTPETVEMPSTPPPVEKFVSLAKKDLTERLKITEDKVTLVKTAEVTWPNSALGCPSPGKVYPPKKVPGYQILFTANDVTYTYNTDWSGQVVLCFQQGADGSVEPVSTAGPEIGVPIK